MTKDEHRVTKEAPGTPVVRVSSFVRHSTFWLRHFPLVCLACAAVAQTLPEEDDTPAPEVVWDWTVGRGLPEAVKEKFGVLVPPGRVHTGLCYPVYGGRVDGAAPRREAELNAGRVERVAEDLVQMDAVDFVSYGEAAEPDRATRTVRMARAWYDLACDFLFSGQPVEIADEEHRIRSGELLYDRASGLAVFSGGVEIYFTEDGVPATVPANPPTAPGAKKP